MKPTSIENTTIMLEAIQSNPYRILGVYSNSPKKDVVANKGKMTAFLKVGRSVSFPLDLSSILPSLERNGDIVAKADAELSLPGEQIKHGSSGLSKQLLLMISHLIICWLAIWLERWMFGLKGRICHRCKIDWYVS